MERRIVAIMAADIVGYSRMMEADETGTLARQKAVQTEVIAPVLRAHNGRLFKTMGDGMLVEFASPVEAVQCALALQEALEARASDLPPDQQQRMRIGINLGDVMVEDGDLFGDGVNIAARLEQKAPVGGIAISGTVHDHLKSNIDVTFKDVGKTSVKNISQPVRIYQYTPASARPSVLRRLLRPGRWLLRLCAAAAVALALLFFVVLPRLAPQSDDGTLSIIVLPFTNASSDPEQDYFAAGISEDINTDLAQIEGLSVMSPTAAHRFGEANVTAAWIRNALGVDYTLDGTLRRAGDQIRLTVRLTEVASQEQVWAERFDRQIDDVFAIQDEIAERVVAELPASLARAERAYVPNVEAYDAYIRSRAQRIPPTPPNLAAAKRSAERAIALDPQFAGGHAALAFVTLLQAEAQDDANLRAEMNAEAQKLAEEAIRLDAEFGPAWGSLAEAHFRAAQFDEALEAAERAVAYSPTDSLMRGQLGRYKVYAGDAAAGLTDIRTALRMSPDSLPLLYFLGVAQRGTGETVAAVETLAEHRTRLNNRILPAPSTQYIAALVEAGELAKAQEEAAKLLGAFPDYTLERAVGYHRYRDAAEVERLRAALAAAGLG